MKLLVINVGSTSFKYKLFEFSAPHRLDVLAAGRLERIGDSQSPAEHRIGDRTFSTSDAIPDLDAAIRQTIRRLTHPQQGALSSLRDIGAVGFKTVHVRKPPGTYLLDDEVLERMADFQNVAPGHNPAYIEAILSFRRHCPGVPLVGVFESGFHRTIPPVAAVYGVPYEWYEDHGIRKYGFHGASHGYIGRRVPELLAEGGHASSRIVSCHLGGSSSLCAISGGRSIDTTMGFSPQEGLQNATRTGSLDPFVVLYVQERMGLSAQEVGNILSHQGGLLGISGLSGDMRDLEVAAAQGNERARLAIDVFCYGVRRGIAEMAAAMEGVDVIAFTGGIGERSPSVRRRVCNSLAYLGVILDEKRNGEATPDVCISSPSGRVRLLVIATDEEQMVARDVISFL